MIFLEKILSLVMGLALIVGIRDQVKAAPVNLSQTFGCAPIGRVLGTGDQQYPSGSLLCAGAKLRPQQGTVKFICYSSNQVLTLTTGKVWDVDKACGDPTTQTLPCSAQMRRSCLQVRGGRRQENPELLRPYGQIVLNPRPALSWRAISEADHYVVRVEGVGVKWRTEVRGTTLLYPQQEPGFRFGYAYEIEIVAYGNGQPLSASETVLMQLPESVVQTVQDEIRQIQALQLPKSDLPWRDAVTVYRSQGLLSEAIALLETQVAQGGTHPKLYRMLADLYLELGEAALAQTGYEQALKLAKKTQNREELHRAQAGLELVAITTNSRPE